MHATLDGGVPKELQDDVVKALGKADRALVSWAVEASDFVPPPGNVRAHVLVHTERRFFLQVAAAANYRAFPLHPTPDIR